MRSLWRGCVIALLGLPLAATAALDSPLDVNHRAEDPAPSIATNALSDQPVRVNLPSAEASRAEVLDTLPPLYIEKPLALRQGQVLTGLLQEHGLSRDDANTVVHQLSPHLNPRAIRPDQELLLTYRADDLGAEADLLNLTLNTPGDKTITLTPQADRWEIKVEKRVLDVKRIAAEGVIRGSLFESANKAGLSDRQTMEMIEIFSYDYDFTRELKEGDTFKVYFERIYTPDGQFVRTGNILAAALDTKSKDVTVYRGPDGIYRSADGLSRQRLLMRFPLKFSRISSGFNLNRKHPVLGFTRAHRGTDFAAPIGTPVRAAGTGTIDYIGWKGGYGKYIRIRHTGTYKTAYAHLHRFTKGLQVGSRVQQGQVIGQVGTTGMSSGPHLHYEVHVNNVQVDPMKAKLPVGVPVENRHKAQFAALVTETDKAWRTLNQPQLAEKR